MGAVGAAVGTALLAGLIALAVWVEMAVWQAMSSGSVGHQIAYAVVFVVLLGVFAVVTLAGVVATVAVGMNDF